MRKVTPFLWFDHEAEEAAQFYTSLFKNSKVGHVTRYGEGEVGTPGVVRYVEFELDGQPFMALNGGPYYRLNPAFSVFVNCETQAEVDALWEKLSAGGEIQQCGWLTDRFGLTWQIVPTVLGELLGDQDPVRAKRVMDAMLEMTKIDIAGLRRAYEQ